MLIRHPDYDLSAADAVVGMNLCHHQGTMVTTTGATMVRHFALSERHLHIAYGKLFNATACMLVVWSLWLIDGNNSESMGMQLSNS